MFCSIFSDTRTIARMMIPPNRGVSAASKYKSLIKARVPHKFNGRRKPNDNSHFYAARVRYCLEMAAMLGDQALVYSADNKNKIRVGDDTLAVDRRIKINRFFPVDDSPSYLDHDFPVPGYALTPSGYLQLLPSSTPTLTLDHLGREQFVIPKKGPATVVLRSPNSPNNIASHLSDLTRHLDIPARVEEGRRLLVLLVDGGPDFNPNHGTNGFFYGRFFRDTKLDSLIVTSYCPGDSAMNPVEHLWAPCTRSLTSVYLPSTLPGEDTPPCRQKISEEERRRKENNVFNTAMDLVKHVHWRDVSFAGHKISVQVEPSGGEPQPYGEDFGLVKETIGSSARRLHNSDLSDEYDFVARHTDKRIGTTIFFKCAEAECHHCSTNPPRLSASDMSLLRDFPSPRPSPDRPPHFMSFREAVRSSRCSPCEYMPQFAAKELGRCLVHGCRYVFTSRKDSDDHRRKVHRR